jgi:enoyl-CoA hydratase
MEQSMGSYEFLNLDVSSKIAVITLNRPPVNALNIGLYRDIKDAFDEVSARKEDANVAVLTGAGRAFCGGRDLKVADSEDPEERAKWVKAGLGAPYHCGVPVIAAVNGAAVGAGCVLSLVCDIVIASAGAFWAMPEIDAGANPSVATILRGLNQFQARRMAFTGERYKPEDLQRMGVLDTIVPADQLMTEAIRVAGILAAKNPDALRAAKWSANEVEVLFSDFEQAYRAIESKVSAVTIQSKQAKEAVAAFARKEGPLSGRNY